MKLFRNIERLLMRREPLSFDAADMIRKLELARSRRSVAVLAI